MTGGARAGAPLEARGSAPVEAKADARDATLPDAQADAADGAGRDAPVLDFRQGRSYAEGPRWSLACPVFLVGFMGAGKTSVSRKLARNAGVASVDLDTLIERRCDMKIKALFAEYGEECFRAIETETLREVACGEPLLVSCGGGVVLAEANRRILQEHGLVVYLKVTAAEAASRISDVSRRPLFGDLEQAQRVIAGREALYEEVADITIDTVGRGTGVLAREAFRLLREAGVLKRRA